MNIAKHNPGYKLISVVMKDKEFVYGETNEGGSPGLEVYFYRKEYKPGDNFYYSRRYTPDKVPGVYSLLYRHLKKLIPYCSPGYKLSMDRVEYHDICNLQGRYTNPTNILTPKV